MASWYEALRSSAQDEPTALGKIMWYGAFQLAVVTAGIIYFAWLFALIFGMALSQTPLDIAAFSSSVYQYLWIFTTIASALSFASAFCLWSGIRSLSNLDKARFSTPATFLRLILVAVAAAWAGGLLYQLTWSSLIYTVYGFGALLVFVGYIGGVVLGLWRVGRRYDDGLIKNGAIFTIIPILNFIAPILIIAGARRVRGKVLDGVAFTTQEVPREELTIDAGDKFGVDGDDEDII